MSTSGAIDALYKLMNEDLPFEEKASQALAIAEQRLGVDNGHLAEIDPEGNHWRAIASSDPPDGEFPAGLELDLQKTYCRRVLAEESSIVLDDAPSQGWADDPAFREHGLHCYHGSPLTVDGELYGTICFVSETPREEPFTEEDTAFAELVARLLEHELRREHTAAQIERLEQFASVLSHDIRNPLMVAMGRLQTARKQHDSDDLVAVQEALARIDEMISDVLSMARQGQRITETDEVWLTEVADGCWEMVASNSASLTVEGELVFHAAEDRLQHVFENLYRNAIEHAGETVSVRVGPLADGDGFYVEDDGPGLPVEDREAVFEAGYMTSEGGLGLGLAIVETVATAHGWTVEATQSASGGARFEFSDVIVVDTPNSSDQ